MDFRRKAVWGSRMALAGALAAAALVSGCGDVVRQGESSGYLIVERFEGASGAAPDEFGGTLLSDVVTVVEGAPTVFNDLAEVSFRLAMKDPALTTPTTSNFITLSRYRVRFIRADGRNTPGVDVPYGFDGGITGTITAQSTVVNFEIVRHVAKMEAPLAALANNGVIISTIAEVTFFGQDQTGREVSVPARLTVNFGNFADPDSGGGGS
jgi:hypothetical protein